MIEKKYQLAMQQLVAATDLVFSLTAENEELRRIIGDYERSAEEQAENAKGGASGSSED